MSSSQTNPRGRWLRHLAPLIGHAALVAWWLRPLVRDPYSVLPGTFASDNVTFVWNLWWMRYVLHHPGYSFFSTPFLFFPIGADLTLHTHTALPAFIAAIVGPASLVASQNLLIVAHIYLNFVCSYALAYRVVRHAPAAFVASIVFGASPFFGAHLAGHFNLIAAWIVPLVVLAWWDASERASWMRAVACGLATGAAAYIDYYLFVYAATLLVVLSIARTWELSVRSVEPSRGRRRALTIIAALLALDALVVAAILLLHTDRILIGSVRISVRSVSNPVTAGWILIGVAAVVWLSARRRIARRADAWPLRLRVLTVALSVALVLVLPLVVKGARLWSEGRYVSQHYQWRSAPAGIDVATFVLGNPFHAWWGAAVHHVYGDLAIDPIEDGGWIPIGALILAGIALARRRREAAVREWLATGAVFLIWALGPWLMVFGRQSPLVLPAILIRYVPVVANARIPGRAMVVVYLAVALLTASGLTWLLARANRGRTLAWVLAIFIAMECAPAPPPVYSPHIPRQYAELNGPPGAVCELPLGIRDGFGETGKLDAGILLQQTVHERPILGGFVARLPPNVAREYDAMPVVGSFLRLSSGGKLSNERAADPAVGTSQLASLGIAYVVLDMRVATADLVEYVKSGLALHLIAEEDGRVFYEVAR